MSGLPFLMHRKIATVILAKQKPDGTLEPKGEEGEHDPALMSAAEDLIRAVHAKDANAVAEALMAASEILDSDEADEPEEKE